MPGTLSRDLIIRYARDMRTITATEASRNFSELLDSIEAGETVTITRGGERIAEIRPAPKKTIGALRAAFAKHPPVDDEFLADIESARAFIDNEWRNPWGDE